MIIKIKLILLLFLNKKDFFKILIFINFMKQLYK